MRIFSSLFEISTDRLTSTELPRKRVVLLLRWTLFGSLVALGAVSSPNIFRIYLVNIVLAVLLGVDAVVSFFPARTFRSAHLEFALGLFDTALICFVVYHADPSGLLSVFFFLLLLGTAVSTRISQVLLGSTGLSILYLGFLGLGRGGNLSAGHLLVLPVFFATAIHFGYQVLRIRERYRQADRAHRERQELRTVLSILESITSSLDFHGVMFQIASKISEVVEAVRCSVLMVGSSDDTRAHVVAASDDERLRMLPIDLTRYPEVQMAIRQKSAVIIQDVEKSEMMRPHMEELRRLRFHALLVLPLVYQEEVLGTLFLRASRRSSFRHDEVKFCKVIASAAASAVKNSMLYESLQKRMREKEEMAARIRGVFDHSPDLILQLDTEGRIREANRMLERLSGRSHAELISMDLPVLIRGLPPVPDLRRRARPSRPPIVCEGRLLTRDGGERDLSVTVGGVAEPSEGLILIGRDVTEQKRAAALLHRTEKLSSIGEVVASVAHELNNPLSAVLGFSQLVLQKEIPTSSRRDLERISECAARCQKIVQSLLSFARPAHSEKKPLGVNGLLEKTMDLLEQSLEADGIHLEIELADRLPYVVADFHQIQQVITNLVTNAQQALREKQGPRSLLLRTLERDEQVVLEVRDDGPGISADVLPRIFDPFFSTKKERGTGLGLSVSYGIVKDHDGDLLVESHPGEGTVFSVVLPADHGQPEAQESRANAPSAASAGHRVLAVDDEEVIVEVYLQLLQALGHSADTASTGLEALRKIQKQNYDLVITDIKMPKLTGIELYEKVIGIKPEMKDRFIFITGDMNSLTNEESTLITRSPCLLKPVNLGEIETAILSLLPASEAPREEAVSRN